MSLENFVVDLDIVREIKEALSIAYLETRKTEISKSRDYSEREIDYYRRMIDLRVESIEHGKRE